MPLLQAMLALAVLALVVATPPRSGPMLLWPVGGSAAKPWLDRQAGVRIVGIGRLHGSFIVDADRDALIGVALAHGSILLPALPLLCADGALRNAPAAS